MHNLKNIRYTEERVFMIIAENKLQEILENVAVKAK